MYSSSIIWSQIFGEMDIRGSVRDTEICTKHGDVPLLSSLEMLPVSRVLCHFATYPEECVDVLIKVEISLPK